MIGIYKITNKINGKSYIGQSIDIERRWREHKKNIGSSKNPLYLDFKKYGLENFSFEILEECKVKDLDEKEIYWIKRYDSHNKGYNLTDGGQFNKDTIVWNRIKQLLNPYQLKDSTWLIYFYLYSQGVVLNDFIYIPETKIKKSIYEKIGISKSSFYRALDELTSLNILTPDLSWMKRLTFNLTPEEIDGILKKDCYKKVIPIRVYILWTTMKDFNITILTMRRIRDCMGYSLTHTNKDEKIKKELNNLLQKYSIIIK